MDNAAADAKASAAAPRTPSPTSPVSPKYGSGEPDSPKTEQRRQKAGYPTRPRLSLSCLAPVVSRCADTSGPERFLEGYELGEKLGSGTTSVVKRAICRANGRQVAVKCMETGDEELNNFAREEYAIIKKLRHDSIIAAEALHSDTFHVWIVLEFCEDGNLESYCKSNGAFREPDGLLIFKQLLEAVDFMHSKRIVHRDLKPENCLLKKGGRILKVTDFNSAKEIGQGEGSSMMLSDRGTRDFTAPEILLGLLWNERVDVWTSGMILYFLVCAKVPFRCGEASAKAAFARGEIPDSVVWSNVTPRVRLVVLQCLAVDMRLRPAPMNLLLNPMFHDERERPPGWTDRFLSSFCECQMRSKSASGAPLAVKRSSSK